jgi:hypothetical protein
MKKALVVILSLLVATSMAFGQKGAKFQYIGSKKCKVCHNSPKKGAQFKKWQASKHAKAYETLGTAEAKEIAKKKGIADPQKADACLKCHVTGHGSPKDMFAASFDATEGVGCEACHGPGSKYKSMKVMKDLYAGKVDPKTVGFVNPTEETCKKCHNQESPTFKAFNFKEFYAKIAHEIPKK